MDVMGAKISRPSVGPVVSTRYTSLSEETVVVRRRPHVVNGGGFVVTDCKQDVIFRVYGCGVLGAKGKLLLKNGDGADLLLIHKRGGMLQAMNMIHKKWEGYEYDNEGSQRLVFTLKDPKDSCLVKTGSIRISVYGKPKTGIFESGYVEIEGSFPDRDCRIVDSDGRTLAQVGIKKEMVGSKKDLYQVIVKPKVDKAFIIGLISILDYIHGESTIC
ncbi:PREDICTED: protein LURP-one-related 16 [Tarenaya hassleriana]|uniref:protein LURP-one-related 16 n=1 Tax=Tarenaya hassleriana TaxID=28532 RepID=UPI00053C70BB|nr:PREDICTED: protein LURP-one-related 16 [Tarenaya hassleriana]